MELRQLNKTKNTIDGAFWGIVGKIISIVFPFVIRTILIRKFGSEYAGLNSLFTSILQVLSLADLGIGSAIVFSMYKAVSEDNKKIISALLSYYKKIFVTIGTVILILGIILIPFLKFLIKDTIPAELNLYVLYFIYLFNTVISYFAFAYRASVLSAYQREAENFKFQIVSNLLMYNIQIVVLIFFKNYYLYIAFLPIFTLFFNYTRYYYVCKKYPDIQCEGEISESDRKQIKRNILALFMHKIGGVTVNTLDNIIISSFLGLVLLSNYNNYYYLLNAVTAIVMIVFNVLTAGIGNSLMTEDRKKNKQDFFTVFYLNGFIVAVSTACFFTMFQDFISLWIGQEYLFDFVMMVLLCVYYYVHTIRRTIIVYRDAAGMWIDNKWQPIVSAIVNLTLNIILIQLIGIKGVVISTIVSMVFVDIPWETGKLVRGIFNESTRKYLTRLVFYTLITLISCLILNYVGCFLNIGNMYFKLIADFVLAISISTIVFVLFTVKMKEFKQAKILAIRIIKRGK